MIIKIRCWLEPGLQQWLSVMRADGVIISSDGWGNSDVDYTNTCEQLGIRGIPVTGLNFSGTVAKFRCSQ